MTTLGDWYRSSAPLDPRDAPAPSLSRLIRNRARRLLPDPDVRGKTMVVYARQGLRKKSAWAGLFSEFHHALGALAYAERHGAVRVRFDFRSDLYVDPSHGPNWWAYFFSPTEVTIRDQPSGGEVHLTKRLAKFGRHGGFCDDVNGVTPYLYPMTFGIARAELHRLLTTYIAVRPEIEADVAEIVTAAFPADAFLLGVHYRGTDSTHSLFGLINDYRTSPVPYQLYADEVRRVIGEAAPARFCIVVATDESDFVEFMRREFGADRIVCVEDAPRARAGGTAVHFDRTLGVSNFAKGKSGVVDCLLLARTNYLIKGRSNLSDASLVFNPLLPYSFCLR
ncbi:MAG TPA: hypothetical protein VFA59_03390 [Vicinamibacterales bacterium]|nr:hypothetical protein [Vicinamibacterales bacterium]